MYLCPKKNTLYITVISLKTKPNKNQQKKIQKRTKNVQNEQKSSKNIFFTLYHLIQEQLKHSS